MDRELRGTMLGDKEVTLPSYEATLGVTIDAAPAAMLLGIKRRAEVSAHAERIAT
jgi:hypothetical protein